MNHKKYFFTTLIRWNRISNSRQMPWKGEKDPYRIWISEIILQQTRVQQGLNYYQRFIAAFPDVKSLAQAPEQDVFKLWEGLGYYSRCRNLIATARYINDQLQAIFPSNYGEILSLKGIGPYTAAAISSFAFNLPYAVLDGNVFRVLSRYFGIEYPINTNFGKKYYAKLAQDLLDKKNPGEYNQAIMDFGAVICKPAPLCPQCPLQKRCLAFLENKTTTLPINGKIIKQKLRFFNYFILEYKNKIYIKERVEKDIWQNLNEFYLMETSELLNENVEKMHAILSSHLQQNEFQIVNISKVYLQKLTHQVISARFIYVRLTTPWENKLKYNLITKSDAKRVPFPKIITSYLKEKNVPLNLA
jgi:A/G-specific adenine glycosylase